MKILVVSDSHRYNENIEIIKSKVGKLDMVIHCGDTEGTEDYIRSLFPCTVCIVAGNNDYFSNIPQEATFTIGEKRVMVTHGHRHHVNAGVDMLVRDAINKKADIVIFGHTHRPMIEHRDGVIVLNPGSISYPRQADRRPSYIIIETNSRGDVQYTLNYIKR